MAALDIDSLTWAEKLLDVPSFSELKMAFESGLNGNFAEVLVEEVECPDLTQAPFHLAASGLSGSPTIVEVGGPSFMAPHPKLEKIYDLKDIARKVLPNARTIYICGAGAGSHPEVKIGEGIFNLKINADGTIVNETHLARVMPGDESCALSKVPNDDTKCNIIANLFVSEGQKGKVLHVKCKKRLGTDDFITACRNAVRAAFGDKHIGIGGIFLVKNGNVNHHVLRGYSEIPITKNTLSQWLKFYDMPGTLIELGTFVSDEMDLDLHLQHFHCFSTSNWGGHYHHDTTPDTVEYEAFFNVGSRIIRIDQPVTTLKIDSLFQNSIVKQ